MTLSCMTLSITLNVSLSIVTTWHSYVTTQLNDSQHKYTQHNETLHNYNQHNVIQHNNIQHYDIQHNDIQLNDIQHNDSITLSTTKLCFTLCGLSRNLSIRVWPFWQVSQY